MPFVPCKKCVFAIAPEFEPTNFRCHGKMPEPKWGGVNMSQKAYWPIIDYQTEGCGEGEKKAAKQE